MTPLRLIGYLALVVAFFGLASGQLLRSAMAEGGPYRYAVASGILSLAAALAVWSWRRAAETDRLPVYWTCVGVLAAIQVSGGDSSLFYPVFFLCLIWVSLPSIGGSAMELGVVGGVSAALALVNATLWPGSEEPFFSRLAPLLLPSLKLILTPFLFGLVADWMADKDLPDDPGRSAGRFRKGSSGQSRPPVPAADYRIHLLEMLQSRSEASATCLFLKHGDNSYRLEASRSEGDEVIPRCLLPSSHRLVRTLAGMGEPVSIGMDSASQRHELLTYRKTPLPEDSQAWLTACPLVKGTSLDGFILQDFTGGRPGSQVTKDLQNAVRMIRDSTGCGPTPSVDGNNVPWISRLVTAVSQDTLDAAVQGLAGLLSEILPGATISVADVDRDTGRAGVWVSRGPLAFKRRDQTCTGGGIAGWVVKTRSPYHSCRMNKGPRRLYAFSDTDDNPTVVESCIGVPVMVRGDIEALIIAEHEEDDAFNDSHELLLLAGADMMAMAAELADLRGRCSDSTDRDSLTGLPRITGMDRHLRKMASLVESYGWSVGVMVADIDGFSRINLELGYSAGDQVLLEASNRFTGIFGKDIFVARVGSDSFAVCIPKANRAELEAFIQRISNAMSWEFSGNSSDQRLGISVSVGACYTNTNRKVPLLTSEAEQAADDAARTGPGSHTIWKLGLFGREEG